MFRTILLVLFLISGSVGFTHNAQAAQNDDESCPGGGEFPISCRIFTPESGEFAGKVKSLMVLIYHFEEEASARNIFESSPRDASTGITFAGVELGDEYLYFPPTSGAQSEMEVAELKILSGNVVVSWIVKGSDADMAFAILFAYGSMIGPEGKHPQGHNLLPSVDILPAGFRVQEEFLYTADAQAQAEPTKAPVVRSSRGSTAPTAVPTETARSNRSSSSSGSPTQSSSGPIEILDISGKDAGIGDGTVYIYVEVKNTSGRSLSYVHIDVACRDASGSVVGTGIANHLGLAPGSTAILTGIILSVPNCSTIHAQVNPLTN